MMILPPPEGPLRADRRVRDRRVADRRKAAKVKGQASIEPEGPGAPRFADEVEPVSGPAFRARGRGPGRRKSDGASDAGGGESATSRSAARPHAPLVAQLIATALNVEQTRQKRRGSEKDAAALYGRMPERAKPSRGEA